MSKKLLTQAKLDKIEAFRERINNDEFSNVSFETFASDALATTRIHQNYDETVIRLARQYTDVRLGLGGSHSKSRTKNYLNTFYGYILDFEELLLS